MEKLSLILWRERELLELLAYRLELEALVLEAGRTRWLTRANREVEETAEMLRATEVLRATAADEAAQAVGLSPNPTLSALAEVALEPWPLILMEHRDALVELTATIARVAELNRTLLTAGYRSTRETLLAIGGPNDEQRYDVNGVKIAPAPRAHLFDRSL